MLNNEQPRLQDHEREREERKKYLSTDKGYANIYLTLICVPH